MPAGGVFPWWGWLGVGIIAVFWTLSWSRIPALARIQPHLSYMPLWAGYILVVNALCVRRSGASPLTRHPRAYALLFPVSALFWWFFEYLNRYVWNWFYEGVSHMSGLEYALYATVCFSSVLPAVVATAAWLHTFPAFAEGGERMEPRRRPATVFILVQVLLKEPCVLDRARTGNWALFFRFAVAALVCGLAWETWNWHAVAKWVYTVPFVHAFQVWEMPLIGFAGYLPFGVECAAVAAWILPALVEDGPPLSATTSGGMTR